MFKDGTERGKTLNNYGKKFSLLLVVTLLVISATPLIQANAVDSSTDDLVHLGQKIPLTNDQIKATWSNLPTAQEIYGDDGCLVIDLRYSGKQASSMNDDLPDLDSPTVIDMASTIVNCTTSIPNLLNGGIMYNVPQIWLQYNSYVWILVPPKYLTTSTIPTQMEQQGNTWAIGMFNNPTDIAGSYDVWGACTFGQFPAGSFGSGDSYLATDVLTISSSNNFYQLAIALNPYGKLLVINIWSRSTGQLLAYGVQYISASTGVLYNQYIRYSTSGSGAWQFWWNFAYLTSWTNDASTRMLKGFQANVVVESNDFTPQHFQGFSTPIGGTYYYQGVTYPLAATCFLFNGNWVPSLPGHNAPAGRAYMGGTQLGTWGFVGNQPPPSNWGSLTIGETSARREVFTVGAGLPRPSHGSILWTYGPV